MGKPLLYPRLVQYSFAIASNVSRHFFPSASLQLFPNLLISTSTSGLADCADAGKDVKVSAPSVANVAAKILKVIAHSLVMAGKFDLHDASRPHYHFRQIVTAQPITLPGDNGSR